MRAVLLIRTAGLRPTEASTRRVVVTVALARPVLARVILTMTVVPVRAVVGDARALVTRSARAVAAAALGIPARRGRSSALPITRCLRSRPMRATVKTAARVRVRVEPQRLGADRLWV